MPWHQSLPEHEEDTYQLPSCRRTCELLELYGEDLARSKFLVWTALNTPVRIPTSQWERILRGETLNLDNFLSAVCHVTVDEERKAHIGEMHLSFTTYEPKRKVKSASNWATAWQRASDGIVFAFPPRSSELREYTDHIHAEFD